MKHTARPSRNSRSAPLLRGALVLLVACSLALPAADKPAPPPPMQDANGVLAATVPARLIPEPEERGKPYKVPATEWKLDPVLWGWTCELPDGTGLTFGGIHQLAEDGLAHTQLKTAKGWTPIHEELRKANPLQQWHTKTVAVRGACKDALAKARHLYFEGKTSADESKLVATTIDPAVNAVAKDLAALLTGLKGLKGLKGQPAYEAGQTAFALKHLAVAAGLIKPFAGVTTPERMTELRTAQIELEIAAEAFDAEPPPRALSKPAYDAKTKQYAIFGGEHMDYSTNDLWVFDTAKRRWFQRHPEAAPEARFDAHLDAAGDGKLVMRGGCLQEKGYVHVGPAKWIYDLEKNTWTADGHQEKTFPSDMRSARYYPPAMPEQYMAGARPDAAANEATLKAIPVNTWVKLKTLHNLGWARDWSTWVYDPDRDMLYVWGGGHAAYPGNDVARYHMATDRWEMSEPVSLPLGCIGTNEQYPNGFDFNRRPWCRKHVWNSQTYDTQLKMMVQAGAGYPEIDKYMYVYDPDKADWVSRHAADMVHSSHVVQIRNTKHGALAWYGPAWLLDAKSMSWKSLKVEGPIGGASVDGCGLAYDPKRDRMLFVTLGGYAKPFDGQIFSLDLTTLKGGPLNPEGMDPAKSWGMFLREVAYHPGADLFLWNSLLTFGGWNGKAVPDTHPAYDAAKNRWVGVKIAGGFNGGVSGGLIYDAKRDLFWAGNAGYEGGVYVMRFDPSKAEIRPMTDYIPPGAPAPAAK